MNFTETVKKRRSPRAFSDKSITEEQILEIFESVRWAPSARNEQPWEYFYALKSDKSNFDKFLSCLVPANQDWAKNAQVLILSVGRKFYEKNNSENRYFKHDVGASNAFLVLKATELGFQAHQMGGFDIQKTLETFELDSEKREPLTFIALGYEVSPENLQEDLKKFETAPRIRKNINEFIKK